MHKTGFCWISADIYIILCPGNPASEFDAEMIYSAGHECPVVNIFAYEHSNITYQSSPHCLAIEHHFQTIQTTFYTPNNSNKTL